LEIEMRTIVISSILAFFLMPMASSAQLYETVMLGHLFEPLIPDIRYEHSRKEYSNGAVFSWPVHYWFRNDYSSFINASVFLEPQIVYKNNDARILLGSRCTFERMFLLEAGLLQSSQRGRGVFGGIGLGLSDDVRTNAAIVVRGIKTNKDFRFDISFDYYSFEYFQM